MIMKSTTCCGRFGLRVLPQWCRPGIGNVSRSEQLGPKLPLNEGHLQFGRREIERDEVGGQLEPVDLRGEWDERRMRRKQGKTGVLVRDAWPLARAQIRDAFAHRYSLHGMNQTRMIGRPDDLMEIRVSSLYGTELLEMAPLALRQ